jgi:hypothetical protein
VSLRKKINFQDVATLHSRVPPKSPASEDEEPPIPILDNTSENSKDKAEEPDTINSVINQPGAAHPIQLQSVHWEVPTLWNLLIGPNGTQV